MHDLLARVARPSSLAVAGLSAVLLFYALLKLYSLNFVNGDEHMYFYMSLLVSKGKWPYRDFFFSHPPLQLYIMGALYKLFGYSLALSKAVPSVAAMVSGVHVYLIGKRLVGRLEGVLGTALFLFTFDVLRGSSHFTGANCALAFALMAAYQAVAGRNVLAGILFAIGTFIGVYVAPLALMLIVLLALRSWKESLRLLASYAAACALVCIVFVQVAGANAFWYQVFGYNLNKIAFRYSWFAKFRNVAYLNSLAMIGFVPSIVWAASMWILRGRPSGERVLPGALGRFAARLNLWNGDRVAAQMIFATFICGYFYFYSTRVDYYSYYFMLIMPWMGLMTATVAVDVVRFLAQAQGGASPAELAAAPRRAAAARAGSRESRKAHPAVATNRACMEPLAARLCAVAWRRVLFYRQGIGSDRQVEMGEESSHYTWHDSPYLPAVVNAALARRFLRSPATPFTRPTPSPTTSNTNRCTHRP